VNSRIFLHLLHCLGTVTYPLLKGGHNPECGDICDDYYLPEWLGWAFEDSAVKECKGTPGAKVLEMGGERYCVRSTSQPTAAAHNKWDLRKARAETKELALDGVLKEARNDRRKVGTSLLLLKKVHR
jgi:hypothetical protein